MIDFMPLRERLLYLRRRALGQHHERSKDEIACSHALKSSLKDR